MYKDIKTPRNRLFLINKDISDPASLVRKYAYLYQISLTPVNIFTCWPKVALILGHILNPSWSIYLATHSQNHDGILEVTSTITSTAFEL